MAPPAMTSSPQKRPRRRNHAAPLPLDLVQEVAARSVPATLVRCAATCKELRRRTAASALHGRLRLRRSDDRFVPSLLHGRLVDTYTNDLSFVDDATATRLLDDATTTRLLDASACFAPDAGDGDATAATCCCRPLVARGGLILFEGVPSGHEPFLKLCVYCPATGYTQPLPPGPGPGGQNVLLVGEGGDDLVGRRPLFQVLNVKLQHIVGSYMHIHKFSSEQGTWAPLVRLALPLSMYGNEMLLPDNPLVVGDVVHWLWHRCLDKAYYVLRLHVNASDGDYRVSSTKLPKSFQRACRSFNGATTRMILATATPGGRPIVLVASQDDVISVWAQTERTGEWRRRPDLIVDCEAMKGICRLGSVRLVWFAERSGLVLLAAADSENTFLLDLQSKKVINNSLNSGAIWISKVSIPYEMDMSSWVPTFTSRIL